MFCFVFSYVCLLYFFGVSGVFLFVFLVCFFIVFGALVLGVFMPDVVMFEVWCLGSSLLF